MLDLLDNVIIIIRNNNTITPEVVLVSNIVEILMNINILFITVFCSSRVTIGKNSKTKEEIKFDPPIGMTIFDFKNARFVNLPNAEMVTTNVCRKIMTEAISQIFNKSSKEGVQLITHKYKMQTMKLDAYVNK